MDLHRWGSGSASAYCARMKRNLFRSVLAGLCIVSAIAAIPDGRISVPAAPKNARSFAWRQDSVWSRLESQFAARRAEGCSDTNTAGRELLAVSSVLARVAAAPLDPASPLLDTLESSFFDAAPRAAACPGIAARFVTLHTNMRAVIKEQSRHWDATTLAARDRLYRSLYGGRAAVEEVMLQQPRVTNALVISETPSALVPAQTPSAVTNGVTVHSGDMLVSRGGYPTSALIARGNDYPGNFSHVALVHVDERSHAISVIEAHIEAGVAISSAEKYLADKKLRVLVLRPRADLPAIVANPQLPHLAASAMLARARNAHIPYDFAMDYRDPSKLFCSEVASSAYRDAGLTLWTGVSTISRPGLRNWLAAFGVRHFATQEPSDLEYDPQLQIVAEWHDPATLLDDHIDNAVTDVMLDGADRGVALAYSWYELPVARVMKAYSWVRVRLGGSGPIPEGMSATAALRNRGYGEEHAARATALRARVKQWTSANGYSPPYWTIVTLAAAAAGEQ
jgi:hypothetical protein